MSAYMTIRKKTCGREQSQNRFLFVDELSGFEYKTWRVSSSDRA